MDCFNEDPGTFVDVLRARAAAFRDKVAYRFLEDGETDESTMTFAEVDRQARAVAAALQQHAAPGERILLLYPSCLHYLAGFYGCMYGGFISVPAYPPEPSRLQRTLPRLLNIVADAGCTVALTTSPLLAMSEFVMQQAPALKALRWIATDTIAATQAERLTEPRIDGDTIAFLQYTSGSTGRPKGVILSHSNLVTNQGQICQVAEHSPGDDVVSWLPVYHDLGLIGNLMQPMWLGACCTFMSPIHFLQRPLRWLRAVSRFRAHTTGGPNFGYDLCVRKVKPGDLDDLDLSCWKVAYNGAERVRADTIRRFAETFAPCGFPAEALMPTYGLAEATLSVTGRRSLGFCCERVSAAALQERRRAELAAADDEDALELVSSGPAAAALRRLVVVDPERREALADGDVGEIWVSGPGVGQGYWQNAEATRETFRARLAGGEGPFLRTGDLGYLRRGNLFITGRLKDLLIIRGDNYFPEDIEIAVEMCHPSIRPGCVAAFSVDGEEGEAVVIVAEVERRFQKERRSLEVCREGARPTEGVESWQGERRCGDRRDQIPHPVHDPGGELDGASVRGAIREVIAAQFQLRPEVVLIRAGQLPKTSSGKVQRHACKRQFCDGDLEILPVEEADD